MKFLRRPKTATAIVFCAFIAILQFSVLTAQATTSDNNNPAHVAGSDTNNGPADTDNDGVADSVDNCTLRPNTDQRDTNNDGYGNACDPDTNNDGIVAFGDYAAWPPFFNTVCGDVDQDFNGDGLCNFGDWVFFPQFFLQPPGPSAIDN